MAKTKNKSAGTYANDIHDDSVYINPLTDFGFKRLFYNKELLMSFLNDVVGTDIKDIVYRPTEGLGWFYEERTIIFDLLCIVPYPYWRLTGCLFVVVVLGAGYGTRPLQGMSCFYTVGMSCPF